MTVLLREVGDYRILRCMARSGMADVYLAREAGAEREVVLKVPRADDDGMRESERRGARLQSLLAESDARVPRILDMDEDSGLFFVVMEFVPGEDLHERIERDGRLPWREAVTIAREILDVLGGAHVCRLAHDGGDVHGIVHGDIKPKNVRLPPEGGIKVLDFGIAKALSQSRRLTRNEFGSLPYSSPERIDSGEVDAAADLWAVGVVLYEMLAGELPFQADSTRRLERRILSRAAPPPPPADVPAPLAAVLRKALSGERIDRYPSAAAMRDDLDALLRGEEPLALRELPRDATAEATRRTAPAGDRDEAGTRRTPLPESAADETTRKTAPAPSATAAMPHPTRPSQPVPAVSPRRRRWVWRAKAAALVVLVLTLISEIRVWSDALELRGELASARRADADRLWSRFAALEERGLVGAGTLLVRGALRDWFVECADGLTENYLSDVPTIRESGWLEAQALLQRALALGAPSREVRARLRYVEGQLHRINGQARHDRAPERARELYHEAASAFREAAELRPGWPDPYLGLARTYIYGLDDLDRGIESLALAEEAGYRLGSREVAQRADGHRNRARRLWERARSVRGLPQEQGMLDKVEEDCRRTLELYESIPAYGDSSRNIRSMQSLLDQVGARRQEIRAEQGWWSRMREVFE